MTRKRLLLVGGGHAHLGILKQLRRFSDMGIETTVVSPEQEHPYSGMAPGLVGGRYSLEEIRFPVRALTEANGGIFLEGTVKRIDPEERRLFTDRGETISYDVASFNIGSVVPLESLVPAAERDGIGVSIFPAKPVASLESASIRIASSSGSERIAVVGGGPGGVELAANVQWRLGGAGTVSLYAGSTLLPRMPDRFRRLTAARLEELGVEVITGRRVQKILRNGVVSADRWVPAATILVAVGVQPPRLFDASGLPTGDNGGLLVDRTLRSVAYTDVFGGGDCIDLADRPLDKVGVYAVRETKYLGRNIRATLRGGKMKEFREDGNYLLICNLAGGYGVGTKLGLTVGGSFIGSLKERIDSWFTKRHRR